MKEKNITKRKIIVRNGRVELPYKYTTDAQRVPISIKNAKIVGYKKEWWQFWKK